MRSVEGAPLRPVFCRFRVAIGFGAGSSGIRPYLKVDQMKVTHTTTWQVKMGRQGDFISVNLRAAEIHKRLGASEIKLLAALAGAPQTQWTYVMIFPDEAAFASAMVAMDTDAEWLALGAEFAPDPPAEATGSMLARDLLT